MNTENENNLSPKTASTLRKLFVKALKDIHNAEKQLGKALPEMAKACANKKLGDAFLQHAEETKRHTERLEKALQTLHIEQEEEVCLVMQELIAEGEKMMNEEPEGPVRDAALIIAAQKIEHYEIASYGSICELAGVLGYSRTYDLLEETLEEEKSTDELLSEMAEEINEEAFKLLEEQEE